ncbi:GNAT family N-acetyltransferase [Flavobacterium zepuense]|uniref:GNAT family N-acetyltransferase n=1 Tax=Flavobacterium zepuense TaxID=2593302 RepID=A0A552UX57_9FLAO|nr:GNAT family N-acetyltransferase [Flavobacterium zepuense]TRW22823.1 GNAT family N-acetyltransferase [Flavobacterium zepuense]
MLRLERTDSDNKDFRYLVSFLDEDLAERDGEDHSFYAQFNKVDLIKNVVVAFNDNIPVGCGAFKLYNGSVAEVKRMYVLPDYRNKGIAGKVLTELEQWAAGLGFNSCILETGKKQPEAIALYKKSGYNAIPNYGQYEGIENSVCMQKAIINI